MNPNQWEDFEYFNRNNTFIPRGEPGNIRLPKIGHKMNLICAKMTEVSREGKLCIGEWSYLSREEKVQSEEALPLGVQDFHF